MIDMTDDALEDFLAEDPGGPVMMLDLRYPSRQAFADRVRDPAYLAGAHLRTRALVAAVLQPTDQRLLRPSPAAPGEGNP